MGICVCICIYASIYAYIHHGAVRQGVLPERSSYPSPPKCLGHPAWWSNKRPRHLGESRNRVPRLAPGLPTLEFRRRPTADSKNKNPRWRSCASHAPELFSKTLNTFCAGASLSSFVFLWQQKTSSPQRRLERSKEMQVKNGGLVPTCSRAAAEKRKRPLLQVKNGGFVPTCKVVKDR